MAEQKYSHEQKHAVLANCRSRIDSSRCRNSCRGVTPYRLSVGEAGRIIDLAQLAEEVFR